ncbi:hypothetical protein MLD63_06895 [Paracoccus sp. TK19116]|uniref:Uncharacterized protein n=1 Tax=Paracoccus albicereus TaxID=2922394 RepID=A0ABT1MPC5_9RHOB|nr:hypothetical protein [Paracoccus albicereus]MCQ0970145.1 hypothetical protein [Paracoccus albicereus]
MTGDYHGDDSPTETTRRPGLLRRIRHIYAREGIAGLIGRLRYSFLLKPGMKPPPRLRAGAVVVVHQGSHDLSSLFRDRFGAAVSGSTGAHPSTIHLGVPQGPATASDVVVLMGSGPIPRNVKGAGLVISDDPGRIARLSAARQQVMAVSLPLDEPSLRRIDVLTGRRDPGSIDMSDAIRPALNRRVPRLCLTLPEHPTRATGFSDTDQLGMTMVNGLRYHPSWMGAAYSYRQIARALMSAGRTHALIAQDDMVPTVSFEHRIATAERYFVDSGADMLAGLVTDIDDSFRIRRVVCKDGMNFVHLNKGVGLVMNLFGPRALERIAHWRRHPSGEHGPVTIDRYLAASSNFDVVVPLPFLVGHRKDVNSTMWPFTNGRYSTLLAYSERRLSEMVATL